jgi:hypothetical protein
LSAQVNIFNDPAVSKALQEQLKHLNIQVHENYIMEEWLSQDINDMSEPIEEVLFRRKDKQNAGQELHLKCTVHLDLQTIFLPHAPSFTLLL